MERVLESAILSVTLLTWPRIAQTLFRHDAMFPHLLLLSTHYLYNNHT